MHTIDMEESYYQSEPEKSIKLPVPMWLMPVIALIQYYTAS